MVTNNVEVNQCIDSLVGKGEVQWKNSPVNKCHDKEKHTELGDFQGAEILPEGDDIWTDLNLLPYKYSWDGRQYGEMRAG